MANAAETIKHVSLELGVSPAIVFDSADLDTAVAEIKRGALALNGQVVPASAGFWSMTASTTRFVCGCAMPLNRPRSGRSSLGVELGPIIDKPNQERLLGIIDRADQEARMVVREPLAGTICEGYFITPSMFEIDDVTHDLVQDELFGPIVHSSASRMRLKRSKNPTQRAMASLRRCIREI